jgi:glyoxylase-like metal-dependent hydrolase (beta-lactamase superfamily II)
MRRGGRDSMPEDPFDRDWQAPTGIAETLAPGLRRVLAPNPSAMTFRGTNTYLLGARALAVIDPGPDDDAHLAALRHAIGDAGVSHILVTHAHRDHSALASRLAATTGAPVLAFGGPTLLINWSQVRILPPEPKKHKIQLVAEGHARPGPSGSALASLSG